jgi:hypothetical protein
MRDAAKLTNEHACFSQKIVSNSHERYLEVATFAVHSKKKKKFKKKFKKNRPAAW